MHLSAYRLKQISFYSPIQSPGFLRATQNEVADFTLTREGTKMNEVFTR